MSEKLAGQTPGENGMNENRFNSDVDAAFDPVKRQAQQDWNNYLAGRNYKDANGSVHDAESGKFASDMSGESDDDYYNRMQSDSEAEGPFAGKSLKELAEMVRDAKANDDKTGELDARAAFDDAFMAAAEKYDWQGVTENADGTTTDRNEIADRKLAYFEAIMDADSQEREADGTQEAAEKDQDEEVDTDEQEPEETYTPRHRAENQDEETPLFDELTAEQDTDDSAAREGESQEEYEARQPGRHRADTGADDLEELDEGGDTGADDLEELDENSINNGETVTEYRTRGRRIRDAMTPAGFWAEAKAVAESRRRERGGRLMSRRERIAVAMGSAAFLIGGGLLLMKHGHDVSALHQGNSGGNGGNNNIPPTLPDHNTSSGSGVTPESIRVHAGDGEIKIDQRLLARHGIHVNATEAQRIGEHAGVHPLMGEKPYDDPNSTLDRIGVKPGSVLRVGSDTVKKLLDSARQLGHR